MENYSYNKRKVGLPPGTIFYTGDKADKNINMELYSFDGKETIKKNFKEDSDLSFLKEEGKLIWLNVNGIHNTELINKIGNILNINSLVLEDLTNINQRVKIEVWEDYLFIVLKMAGFSTRNKNIEYEQVSFILGKNYLITFQEKQGDVFDTVRNRIEAPSSKVFQKGIGYLTYALIDVIADNYFVVLDRLEEKTDRLERKILNEFSDKLAEKILQLKGSLQF